MFMELVVDRAPPPGYVRTLLNLTLVDVHNKPQTPYIPWTDRLPLFDGLLRPSCPPHLTGRPPISPFLTPGSHMSSTETNSVFLRVVFLSDTLLIRQFLPGFLLTGHWSSSP